MAEQIGGLEIHMVEGGTNSRRLSSDLHMQPWHICALQIQRTYTHIQRVTHRDTHTQALTHRHTQRDIHRSITYTQALQ